MLFLFRYTPTVLNKLQLDFTINFALMNIDKQEITHPVRFDKCKSYNYVKEVLVVVIGLFSMLAV